MSRAHRACGAGFLLVLVVLEGAEVGIAVGGRLTGGIGIFGGRCDGGLGGSVV
jgi:hypothetical protein